MFLLQQGHFTMETKKKNITNLLGLIKLQH